MRLFDTFRKRATTPDQTQTSVSYSWPSTGNEYPTMDFVSWARDGYGGNPVVFACLNARLNLFTEATFKFRDLSNKRLFGNPDLAKLERPWPGGQTADLLARMEQDVSLGGNAFIRDAGDRLERMRPDRVEIVSVIDNLTHAREVLGYLFRRDGVHADYYPVEEVAHWAPIPDPLFDFRGMSWLTPIVRDVNNDLSMTSHKTKFFENAATPNLVIKYQRQLSPETVNTLRERFDARYGGATGAKTMVLDEGADLTVVGNTFEQMQFANIQAAGETRIAAAASVPPIIAGLQSGLDASTYSNYASAMRSFGSFFMRSHWRSVCSALAPLVNLPDGATLWFDISDIAALQEAETQRADAGRTRAVAMGELIRAGYTPDTVTAAVIADDFALLQHSGAIPTALYPDGKVPTK